MALAHSIASGWGSPVAPTRRHRPQRLTTALLLAALTIHGAGCGEFPANIQQEPAAIPTSPLTVRLTPASETWGSIERVWLRVTDDDDAGAHVTFVELLRPASDPEPPLADADPFSAELILLDGTYSFEARAYDDATVDLGAASDFPASDGEEGSSLAGVGIATGLVLDGSLGAVPLNIYMVTTAQPSKWGDREAGPAILSFWHSEDSGDPQRFNLHALVLFGRSSLGDGAELSGNWDDPDCAGTFDDSDRRTTESGDFTPVTSGLSEDLEGMVYLVEHGWSYSPNPDPETCTLRLSVTDFPLTDVAHAVATEIEVPAP